MASQTVNGNIAMLFRESSECLAILLRKKDLILGALVALHRFPKGEVAQSLSIEEARILHYYAWAERWTTAARILHDT